MTEDNRGRLRELCEKAEAASASGKRWGQRNYLAAYGVIVSTVLFSGAASISGFLDQRPEVVGVLALMPGLLTLAATQLKMQARSNWHFKKRVLMEELVVTIKFGSPENPSATELAALAKAYSRIQVDMEDEWTRHLNLDPPRPDPNQP